VRILVTNDDGVDAPGIAVLAAELAHAGHEVTVAAPSADSSGAGAAVGPRAADELVFCAAELRGAPDVTALRVEALPAFIVYAGCRGAFGPIPDIVCSGINRGRNVGGSVFHSGTVGAALTAAQLGHSALAVSLQARGPLLHYDTAAGVAVRLVSLLTRLRTGTVLNCNVPNLRREELRGVRRAALARTGPILPPIPLPRGEVVDGTPPIEKSKPDEHSDDGLTLLGWATVTALVPVQEDPDEMTSAALDRDLADFADLAS
jgi:5'-nucleotidase